MSRPHFAKHSTDLQFGQQPAARMPSTLREIAKYDHVLTPGRDVGAADEDYDGEPFAEKMARLTTDLDEQFKDSSTLEKQSVKTKN